MCVARRSSSKLTQTTPGTSAYLSSAELLACVALSLDISGRTFEQCCVVRLRSGFNVTGIPGGGDPLSMMVAEKIGRAYDEALAQDKNGVLTFDEFVQLRLEWDCYLDAWSSNVPMGSNSIAPQQLLGVLAAHHPLCNGIPLPVGSPTSCQLGGPSLFHGKRGA
eukprot:1785150-Amphidinium_carterae.2